MPKKAAAPRRRRTPPRLAEVATPPHSPTELAFLRAAVAVIEEHKHDHARGVGKAMLLLAAAVVRTQTAQGKS